MLKNLLILFTLIFSFSLNGQDDLIEKKSQRDAFCLYKNTDSNLNHTNFFSINAEKMGLSADDDLVLVKTDEGKNDYKHYSYDQYYKGIKVYGQRYILHERGNNLSSANGSYLPQLDLNVKPKYSERDAISQAMIRMNEDAYGKVESELIIIDKDMPNFSGLFALCYKVDLRTKDDSESESFFIDAHSGKLLKQISRHQHIAVPGKGLTRYYGEQSITVDSLAPDQFVLSDPTRGNDGIIVRGSSGDSFTSTSSYFDLTNDTQDEVAVDALYLCAEYYDLLRDDYDWLGLDNNNGSFIVNYMNDGSDFLNAFWNGTVATFGSGDCNNGPLITADVLAHEFMHGIIDYTSQLIYFDESGAINESLADVLGKALEYHVDEPNFNWDLGKKFALYDQVEPFRVMDDPEQVENPAYYGGPFWEDGADVHYNSAIGNLYFVRLSEGAVGTDFSGYDYEVASIGLPEAAQFIFHTNRHYLNPSSTYNDYYDASLLAAEEYFSGDQSMIDNVLEAWKSVGIPGDGPSGGGGGTDPDFNTDLSTTIQNGFLQVCGFGNPFEFEFTITNEGKNTYDGPSALAKASITFEGDVVKFIDLDMTILPGESVNIESGEVGNITDSFGNFRVDLIYSEDENRDNNGDNGFVLATEFETDDLTIQVITSGVECFSTSSDLDIVLQNESCEMISDETVKIVLIEAFSGDTLYQEEVFIDTPIFPGTSFNIERTIEHGFTSSKFVNAIVIYPDDPNQFNNISDFQITVIETAPIDYVNELDVNSDLSDGILYVAQGGGFTSPFGITGHEGGEHFYTTGPGTESFSRLCINPDENYDGQVGGFFSPLVTEMIACVDYTGITDPSIEFDLIQFRNDDLRTVSDYSSSIQVRWSGTDNGLQTIGGQAEGETVNHVFDFPSDFKGSFNIRFLNLTGNNPFSFDFLDYDVNMIDYINFGQTVSTTDITRIEDQIVIYPDPVSDILNIKSEHPIKQVVVFDLTGKQLASEMISNNNVDLSQLIPGHYTILCTQQDGHTEAKRFIKI